MKKPLTTLLAGSMAILPASANPPQEERSRLHAERMRGAKLSRPEAVPAQTEVPDGLYFQAVEDARNELKERERRQRLGFSL